MTRTTDETGERRPRKPAWPLAILIVSVGCTSLTLGYLAHESLSTWLYTRAFDQYSAAHETAADAADVYAGVVERADRATSQSEALEAVADPAYVDPAAISALSDAADALASTIEHAPAAELDRQRAYDEPDDLTSPAWQRYADAAELIESRDARIDELEELETASREVKAARQAALEAHDGLFGALAATAEQALAEHPSASYRARIEVRHAIDQSGPGWVAGQDSPSAFSATILAIDGLRASHAFEEARRLEPEYPLRAEIEAFARSISAGVTLDFAWAHEVNGLSSDEWYSGTAEFWPTDGGWGLINLTHSISDNWYDDPNTKAVVVHEVGHTQVVRPACEPLFSGPEFGGDHEMWATAWAIGMGYDLPGSGIEAYGRPSDAQIAVASQCR
jgi:hypothetical protein